jgi:hypothetical protein
MGREQALRILVHINPLNIAYKPSNCQFGHGKMSETNHI